MSAIRQIPEIAALRTSRLVVRIPPETDVPLTPRVKRLLDTSAMRRLANVGQLGLVRLVYPGATHSRLEHSLGAYRNALLFVDRLAEDERFAAAMPAEQVELFLVAALLHDIGHWPYCHPIEDMGLDEVPDHEVLAQQRLAQEEIAALLSEDWRLSTQDVGQLLCGNGAATKTSILCSMLSGPIDVDKMDYLSRDSLHAGVPYGRHFDQLRLVQSLCLNEAGNGLAITEKGKTAAEMMVFSRYVMFSEVYWHHAVRSATAMLQRAFFELRGKTDLATLTSSHDAQYAQMMISAACGTEVEPLVDGLFGPKRMLYKRCLQFSYAEQPELFVRLSRRPYERLTEISDRLAAALSESFGRGVDRTEILIDAPPAKLEVQFDVDVLFRKENRFRRLGDISPVVSTLAERQFDDFVKRVRLFAAPRIAEAVQESDGLDELLLAAASDE